jgi:hypothetical protein
MTTRKEALAKHLNIDADDIKEQSWSDSEFEAEGGDWLVLTDEEADERVKEQLKETLWAFRAEFIASHTRNGLSDECIKALKKMQGELCESANPIVEALIEDLDAFYADAMRSDGRGHFLSSYDGEEIEAGEYYIYRTN